VFNIDSLVNIFPSKPGWEIKVFNNELEPQLHDPNFGWDSNIIAVLGMYDKGKTFLLNLLAQTSLLSSSVVTTEGLSLKHIDTDRNKFILLDTAGMDPPIKGKYCWFICLIVVAEQQEDLQSVFAAHQATELFLRDVTYNLADICIVVVNELTARDQLFIHQVIFPIYSSLIIVVDQPI
jgi:hypothetical protein